MLVVLLFFGLLIAAIAGVIAGSKYVLSRKVAPVSEASLITQGYKKNPKLNLKRYAGIFFNTGMILTLTLLICAFSYRSEHVMEFVEILSSSGEKESALPPVTEYIPPAPVVNIESLDIVEVPEKQIVEEIIETLPPEDYIPQETGDIMDMFENPGVGGESFEAPDIKSERSPKFKGDFDAFMEKHKKYPELARDQGISGTVTVRVYFDNKGVMLKERTQIVKGIHPDLNNEAIRLLHLTADTYGWEPARSRGNNVAAPSVFSITFNLND